MSAADVPGIDRRSLLRAFGTGAALLVGARFGVAGARPSLAAEAALDETLQPSLWLAIAPDGAVRIWAHRSEMGTGIRTSLPMVVADELGCDWERVKIEQAFGDAAYGDQNTDGSWSVRGFYETMRKAGAGARWLLEQAAAKQWGVDAKECIAREHAVHGPGGKKLGFGELVATARGSGWTVDEVYTLFPRLSERRGQPGQTLSGGEQQMLAIGRALLTSPKLLILDEATEGLAPIIRQEIWTAIRGLKARGQAILVVDKSLKELLPVADRCVVLERGANAWTGDAATFAADTGLHDRYLGV